MLSFVLMMDKSSQSSESVGESCAFQATNSTRELPSLPLTAEQLERLCKILEPQTSNNFVVQKENYALLSVSLSRIWIVASGATDHMIGDSSILSSYTPCAGNHKIKIVDDSFLTIAGKCSIAVSSMLTLKDVLYIPNLSCGLLYASKLVRDKPYQANFSDSHCVFEDLNSGKTIGCPTQSEGFYYLHIGSQQPCF